MLFVDLVKVFDTVNHRFLLLVLRKYGMPVELVSVIDRMYQDFKLTFSVCDAYTIILYTIRVHQCNNLAPILFNIYFQATVESLVVTWKSEHSIATPEF